MKFRTAALMIAAGLVLAALLPISRFWPQEPKTVVLDAPEEPTGSEGPGVLQYQTKKIYHQDPENLPFPLTPAAAWTPTGDNRLVRAVRAEDGGLQFRAVDYRYGFFETVRRFARGTVTACSLAPGGGRAVLELQGEESRGLYLASLSSAEDEEPLQPLKYQGMGDLSSAFWSPDGRYFAFVTWRLTEEELKPDSYYEPWDYGTLTLVDTQYPEPSFTRDIDVPRGTYQGVLSNDGNYLLMTGTGQVTGEDNAYLWNTRERLLLVERGREENSSLVFFDSPVRSVVYTERDGVPTFLYTTPQMIGQVTIRNGLLKAGKLQSLARPDSLAVTADGTAVAYSKEAAGGADIYLARLSEKGLSEGTLLYKNAEAGMTLCFGSHDRCLLAEVLSARLTRSDGAEKEGEGTEILPATWTSATLVIELR